MSEAVPTPETGSTWVADLLMGVIRLRGLRWFFDLRILPPQLNRGWGIPYKRWVLRFFHRLRTASAYAPRSRHLWCAGSSHGFSGNTGFLFLHQAMRKGNRARMIWIARSWKELPLLRNHGLPCFHQYSIGGVLACLFSKIHLINHGTFDTNYWVSGGARYVQLWHGLPLKKVYWDIQGEKSSTWLFLHTWHGRSEAFWRFRTPWNFGYENSWLYASCSEVFSNRYVSAFKAPAEAFHQVGFARNDYILHHEPAFDWTLQDFLEPWKAARARANQVILYAPTWREYPPEAAEDRPIFTDWEILNDYLGAHGLVMIFKAHPLDRESRMVPKGFERILVCPQHIDSTCLMACCDMLISDYSSIYVDYLSTQRPVAFLWYDDAYYQEHEKEFYEDMIEHLPGPIARNGEELIAYLEEVRLGKDHWVESRALEYKRLFAIREGSACERTLDLLEKKMSEA